MRLFEVLQEVFRGPLNTETRTSAIDRASWASFRCSDSLSRLWCCGFPNPSVSAFCVPSGNHGSRVHL